MVGRSKRRQQDMRVARNLFLLVITDFCCWFPVGVMGLLAAQAKPIPGVVNVMIAIFKLPLNSALKPFLYTFNTALERRRKMTEERQIQDVGGGGLSRLIATRGLQAEWTKLVQSLVKNRRVNIGKWPAEQVTQLCLQVNLAAWTADQILKLFSKLPTTEVFVVPRRRLRSCQEQDVKHK